MPRFASALFMNVSHTKPVRRFSAISKIIPVSIPITSESYQFFNGLNAFTKPYFVQDEGYLLRIVFNTRRVSAGKNGKDPPAALGTTDPSMGPMAGGPPQTTYPCCESEVVIHHISSLYYGYCLFNSW